MDATVDVVLLTKNSERALKMCLDSLYAQVPVRRLIVVDGYSTDKTLDIIGAFQKTFGNVKVVFDHGTRGSARQKGIANVESDWFLFIDSDVVLCKDWFKKASKYVKDGVGAVWGIEVWSTIANPKTLGFFLRVTKKVFDVRGGTHDTLIKTAAVKGITIPSTLHVFEDAYIKDWIEKQGYNVVACYDPFCIHYRDSHVWTVKGSLGLIVEAVRYGSFRKLSKLMSAYAFYTVYSVYQMYNNKK
jgi:glycosyltransferase involved in cell wall biosynthesis